MPQKTLQQFQGFINNSYNTPVPNPEDILIDIDRPQLYSKKTTLNILREFQINTKLLKKVVSINETGHLVVDNILSRNVFTSIVGLTENDEVLQKDQLIFVEDENDNTRVNVYKISFNEEANEIRPEFGEIGYINLQVFNDYFVNSGLFKEEVDVPVEEKVTRLLVEDNNPFADPVWETYKNKGFGYTNTDMVNAFKVKLNQVNLEEDYFIYREDNKTIIQSVNNPNHKISKEMTINAITDNDVFYFSKTAGEGSWKTYKINKEKFRIYTNYKEYKFVDLTDQEFNNYLKNLDILNQPIVTQLGFNKVEVNDGLVGIFKTEKENKHLFSINVLTEQNPALVEEIIIAGNNIDTIRTSLAVNDNDNNSFLYSLKIENNRVILLDEKSNPITIIFDEELSQEHQYAWQGVLAAANQYNKVYFTKDIDDETKVKQWVIKTDNNQNKLQCLKKDEDISIYRNFFVNNNLFYTPNPLTLNGLHLGINGTQIDADEQIQAAVPIAPLKPVVVKDVINLKWNNDDALWDLNITDVNAAGEGSILKKQIKLETEETNILNDLLDKNNNRNTVILFNKYTGDFLWAYYFANDNKKVNCSNLLTDDQKQELNKINKKAKLRINEKRIISPIFKSTGMFNNYESYDICYTAPIKNANAKWTVLCKDEFSNSIDGKMPLNLEEISALAKLLSKASNIKITFNKNGTFENITYFCIEGQKYKTIKNNDLLEKRTIDYPKIMKKIFDSIKAEGNIESEDDGITPINWNNNTTSAVNATPPSPSTRTNVPTNNTPQP